MQKHEKLMASFHSFHLRRMLRCYSVKPRALCSLGVPRMLSTQQNLILDNIGKSMNHPMNNIPDSVYQKIGKNLHNRKNHPLNIIKTKIELYFNSNPASLSGHPKFDIVDDLPPIASLKNNFDDLRIEEDHVSRKPTDTYYLNENEVLRTHTSAHQTTLLSQGRDAFLCCGDVYRRDEVDRTHHPVFHQMEGVRVWRRAQLAEEGLDPTKFVEHDLKSGLEGVARELFGDCKMRWNADYFPFTEPSFELEVLYQGDWLEVLGCGVIHPQVLRNAGRNRADDEIGWAFGLGLERLAMILFNIPDIRLFWTDDDRFHSQFEKGDIVEFKPYSKYPPCLKDVSYWLPETRAPHQNDLFEVIREVAGDMVEQVSLIDEFTHPKTGRHSQCFRITYRDMSRSLTNEEVDMLQNQVRTELVQKFGVELR
mmetsp:Transcript_34773/g.57285  ORF Transcript_34773/g.57285 Transcript_34773/m.57285 type:complete len:423 (+) Transcript_34773:48-1316(+)